MSRHTPGPWFYGIAFQEDKGPKPFSYRGPGYYENAGIIAGDQTIVGCDEYDIFFAENDAEREANIRLICAAPDLLAELLNVERELDEALQYGYLPGPTEKAIEARLSRVRAAIAKAAL